MATTREEWIAKADSRISQTTGFPFPPIKAAPLQKIVAAAWKSFRYLQGLRRNDAYKQDLQLACAEHYAYARAVTAAGGALVFPFIVTASFGYQAAKALFDKLKLRQQIGELVSQGHGYTTPASEEQLEAAEDGAEDGLKLHYQFFKSK